MIHVKGAIGQEGGQKELEISLESPSLLPAKYIGEQYKGNEESPVNITDIHIGFPDICPVFQRHTETKQQEIGDALNNGQGAHE